MPKHKEYWSVLLGVFFLDETVKSLFSTHGSLTRFNNNWCNLGWEETYGLPVHIVLGRDTRKNTINVNFFVDKLLQNEHVVDSILSRKDEIIPLFPDGFYPQPSKGKPGREPQEYFFKTILEVDDVEDEMTWNMQIAWMKRQAIQFRTLFDEIMLDKALTKV